MKLASEYFTTITETKRIRVASWDDKHQIHFQYFLFLRHVLYEAVLSEAVCVAYGKVNPACFLKSYFWLQFIFRLAR